MKPRSAANCAIFLSGSCAHRRHQPCEHLGQDKPIEKRNDSDDAVGKTRLNDLERSTATAKNPDPPSRTDKAVRDELIMTHRYLARQLARRLHFSIGKCVALEDLVAYGDKGLVEAASRFDRTKGIPFRAFAWRRVEGSIVDGIRAHSPLSRRAYERLRASQARPANDTGTDVFQVPHLPTRGDSDDWRAETSEPGEFGHDARWNGRRMAQLPVAEDDSLEVLVATELRRLPERERRVLDLCYYRGKTLTGAALEMGNGRSWASRLHAEGLAAIRAAIETSGSLPLPSRHTSRKHRPVASRHQENTTERKDGDCDGRSLATPKPGDGDPL